MLPQEGQLAGPPRGSHGVTFFFFFLSIHHDTRSRNSVVPGTGSWAFSELTDLRKTGSQTHKRLMCTSECQLIPVNSEKMDDLPLQCLGSSHFPMGTTMPQAGTSRSLTVPRDHFMSVELEQGEVIS